MAHKFIAMANLSNRYTGLPNGIMVYVSMKDGPTSRHAARVKVSNVRNGFDPKDSWSIGLFSEDLPLLSGFPRGFSRKELDEVREFLLRNRQTLLEYWNLKIGFDELTDQLKRT